MKHYIDKNIKSLILKFGFKNIDKLWKLLIDKNLTKTDLRRAVGMSTSTLSRMSKNENVSMDLLDKICTVLDCDIKEIIEHIKVDN